MSEEEQSGHEESRMDKLEQDMVRLTTLLDSISKMNLRDWLSGWIRFVVLFLAFIGLGTLLLFGGCAGVALFAGR